MATQSRADLKEYFEDGDTPNEAQFVNLIDSMLNLADTGTQTVLGTISASGFNAGNYSLESLDFSTVTSEIHLQTLTGSNVFGSESSAQDSVAPLTGVSSHSFFGPIYQSSSGAHSASYFLSPVILGGTETPLVGEGLHINTLKVIASSTSPINQASASALLISGAGHHLAVDANEIHHYGNNNLHITSQGDTAAKGNITFKTSVTPTSIPSASLFISSSGFVGVGAIIPKYDLSNLHGFQTTGSVSFTGPGVYVTIDDYDMGSQSAALGSSGSRLISRDNHLMVWNGGLTVGNYSDAETPQTASGALTVKGHSILTTVSCSNIDATGSLKASASYVIPGDYSATGDFVVIYNTSSGQFNYTGSYGGGGGGDTTSTSPWATHADGYYLSASQKNVGIGGTPDAYSSGYRLKVHGTMAATADVIAYMSSDRRLKDNIKPIEDPIGKLKKIGGYSFDWNDKQNIYKGSDFGVIAQEIEEVLPSLVKDREDGYKGVKYDKIVSLLIEAVKDQQKQIDELKKLI
tara:strand:- start:419 stop:1978 length:1560 start_codon:yes stop_codon:yes gene_type:complete